MSILRLDFREGNSDRNEFFIDAIRYGTSNKTSNAGKTNQVGAEIRNDIGPLFGGTGFLSALMTAVIPLIATRELS